MSKLTSLRSTKPARFSHACQFYNGSGFTRVRVHARAFHKLIASARRHKIKIAIRKNIITLGPVK